MQPDEERKLKILRYSGKVPAMAACGKCQRKFFTPDSLLRDTVAANEYLQVKFGEHVCPGNRNKKFWL